MLPGFITWPTPQTIIASSSEWSAPFFAELTPLIYVSLGFLIVGVFVVFVINRASDTIHTATGHRKDIEFRNYGEETYFTGQKAWRKRMKR